MMQECHYVDRVGYANASTHRRLSEAEMLQDESGRLRRFHAVGTASVPGTNVSAWKITAFSIAGAVLDRRALSVQSAGGDAVVGLAKYAAEQGTWFSRREGFEDLWVDGRRFIYLAVNPGNVGVTDFGLFCLIVGERTLTDRGCAVFPSDTAQRYTSAASDIDTDRVLTEVGSWDSRADMSVIELATRVLATNESEWPQVLCGRAGYLEVVTFAPMAIEQIIECRISRDAERELKRMSLRRRSGVAMDPSEAMMADAFNLVRKWPNTKLRII